MREERFLVQGFQVASCLSELKVVGFMYTTRQDRYDDLGACGRAMCGKD